VTLTRSEYAAARDRPELLNGTAPVPESDTKHVSVSGPRTCEVCATPLNATQKHVCSPPCAGRLRVQRLGGTATKAKRPKARTQTVPKDATVSSVPVTAPAHSDGLLALLEHLPPEVLAVELAGWRCVRA
jgi:hypothetical protein